MKKKQGSCCLTGPVPYEFGEDFKNPSETEVVKHILKTAGSIFRNSCTPSDSRHSHSYNWDSFPKLDGSNPITIWYSRVDEVEKRRCTVIAEVVPLGTYKHTPGYDEKIIARAIITRMLY